MSIILNKFNTSLPIPSIYPNGWSDVLIDTDTVMFSNLDEFVFTVSKLKQAQDDNCGMRYEEALGKLIRKQSDFPKSEQESIRNLVRSNLLKRGLITEEIYENFRYTTDGTNVGVDIGKYAAGEADCVLTPSREYIDYFYELYISISYSYNISNETVRKNVAKLLATIEELERKHIFIKVNIVLPINNVSKNKKFFSCIPVFSHKDFKDVDIMSSVINDRLLRKFYFAILENLYSSDLNPTYGTTMELNKSMNIGNPFDEIELFEQITNSVGS